MIYYAMLVVLLEIEDMRNFGMLRLKPGSTYELIEDVNCIPKGVYRFREEMDGMLVFSVGKKVIFGIESCCLDKLRSISKNQSHLIRTGTKRFVERYYELLRQLPTFPRTFDSPTTFCGLDPSLALELN